MDFNIFGFLSALFLGIFIWEAWTHKKELAQSLVINKVKTSKFRTLKDRSKMAILQAIIAFPAATLSVGLIFRSINVVETDKLQSILVVLGIFVSGTLAFGCIIKLLIFDTDYCAIQRENPTWGFREIMTYKKEESIYVFSVNYMGQDYKIETTEQIYNQYNVGDQISSEFMYMKFRPKKKTLVAIY